MTALDGRMPGRAVNIMAKAHGQTRGGDGPQQRAAIGEVACDFESVKKIDHIDTMGGICL
jgi:hypothetical protein